MENMSTLAIMQNMLANGSVVSGMAEENKLLQMALITRGNGSSVELMELANFTTIILAIHLRANLTMILYMGQVD